MKRIENQLLEEISKAKNLSKVAFNNETINIFGELEYLTHNQKPKHLKDGSFIFRNSDSTNIICFETNDYSFLYSKQSTVSGKSKFVSFAITAEKGELKIIEENLPFRKSEVLIIYDNEGNIIEKNKYYTHYLRDTKNDIFENLLFDNNNNIVVAYNNKTSSTANQLLSTEETFKIFNPVTNSYVDINSDLYFLYKFGKIDANQLLEQSLVKIKRR